MIANISGRERTMVSKPPQPTGPLTEEEIERSVEAFEAKEMEVAEIISNAKTKVNDDDVANRMKQLLEKFGMIKNTVNQNDPLGDVQWVMDIQKNYYSW